MRRYIEGVGCHQAFKRREDEMGAVVDLSQAT